MTDFTQLGFCIELALMAGLIPQGFIDDLIARSDIVELVDSRVPLKNAGREYKACCPFHDEKTPSFTVSADKQFYHCFGCGAHGTAIGFLMNYEHMDFVEAIEHLAARHGLEVPREGAGSKPGRRAEGGLDLLQVLDRADQFYREQLRHHPEAERAVAYLKERGLSGQTAARFGLGFAPGGWDNLLQAIASSEPARRALEQAGLVTKRSSEGYYDRFRSRIMFPIHDHRGRVVGFGGRVLDDAEPKYLNSPETPVFHKGAELYGLYAARGAIKSTDKALVVEGYMDVVALNQHGIEYAVGTLGTATTRAHLERVYRYCTEVVFCFDGDRAGRAAAWRALESLLPVLGEGRQASFLFLPEGDDPDSFVNREGPDKLEARIGAAVPFADFLIQHLAAQTDIQRMDGRARLLELAKPLVNKLPGGALQELLKDRLAELSQMERATLDRLLTGGGNVAKPGPARTPRPSGLPGLRRSAVRELLTVVIQNPEVAQHAGDIDPLRQLEVPGIALLAEVIETIVDSAGLTTAGLLERFRGHEHHPHLEKLAARTQIDESRSEEEFRWLMNRLTLRLVNQQIDALRQRIQKEEARDGRADEASRKELDSLLRSKKDMEIRRP